MVQTVVIIVIALVVAVFAGWTDRHGGWAAVTGNVRRGVDWTKEQLPKKAPAPAPALATTGAVGAGGETGAAGTEEAGGAGEAVETAPPESAEPAHRVVVEGVLAPRLPEPRGAPRVAHWWRAAGLLLLGVFAVFFPDSLTTLVVVLIGLAALYLALTEAIAAWGSPRAERADEEPEQSPTDGA
jgi:hypothetical protein